MSNVCIDEPINIPNLPDLHDALEANSDSQKLLDAFKGTRAQIAINLAKITKLWLEETEGKEDAA